MADTRRAFLDALKAADAKLYRAFMDAIGGMRDAVRVSELEQAVESGNVARVVEVLHISDPALEDLAKAVEETFRDGASYQNGAAPGRQALGLEVAFDGRHMLAEAWMRRNSAALVTEIIEDQRRMVRETMLESVETGRSYRKTALDIIGRTEGKTRKGGILGLHSKQAAYVRNARRELEDLDEGYFERTRRDKRFDRTVRKAIREGTPLSAADIDRITGRYADRLLQTRGNTIARTEANKALNAGRSEAIRQMIESGEIKADHVTKTWQATPGPTTRDSHRELNGEEVKWGQKFVSQVTGAAMDWPYDEDAPPEEVINCRCTCTFSISWRDVAKWRDGEG